MKNKHIVLICLFSFFIFIFPILFIFSKENVVINEEKRELVGFPKIQQTGVSAWPSAMEEYFRDHLPYRHSIIRFNAVFNKVLFNSTTSNQIMLGKQNWLFMKDSLEDKNLSDYQGLNRFSESELEQLVNEFSSLATQQEEKGRKVILLMPPNKERVYSKFLPKGINQIIEQGKTQQLYQALDNHGSKVLLADPTDKLINLAVDNDDLYYKYDAHWNAKGAYIGLCSILEQLDVKFEDFKDCDFKKTGNYYSGDIAALGALGYLCDDDDIYKLDNYTDLKVEIYKSELIDNLDLYKSDAVDKRRVLFLGDSFSYELKLYMSNFFSEVGYTSFTESSAETIDKFAPDVIIIEQVERHAKKFLTYLPNYIN